jgi:hypothetical protein
MAPPATEVSTQRRWFVRIATAVFVVVVIAFFAISLVDAWHDTNGELPSAWRLLAAAALSAGGMCTAGYAWATLLGGDRALDHGAALIVTQLGKYVPGGVWQATGQVGLARSAGVELPRAATSFTVLAIVQAVAGSVWGIVLAFAWTDARVFVRVLLGVGALASLALIDRRWMVWVLHRIPRTREASDRLIPAQGPIVRAWLGSLVTMTAACVAYLLLLGSLTPVDQPILVLSAYAIAWTVGFLALPVPSGFGIREAVLVGTLHSVFPASVIVAASVYLRLVVMGTEGVMAAIVSHRVRPSRAARTPQPGDVE